MEEELRQECLKLMETVEVSYLSTIDSEGFPQTRAMGNLRNIKKHPGLREIFRSHADDFLIYIGQDGWEMYWPGGVDDPEYTILRLLPAFAKGWHKGSAFEFKLTGKMGR